jgi:hypothetical protein
MMKEIEKSWNEFRDKPFPVAYTGMEVECICITTVDTFAAGCIDTFVDRGRLDRRRISVLKDCAKDLGVVVKHLDGEAKDYFEQLRSLAEQVLSKVN